MKILNEAHIPDKISVNHLEKIADKIFEVNRVTFSDDELPIEGTEHNRALYFTVKCEDSVVTRVLVDSGSSANICPLSILNKLKVDDERIHKNSICVRGFDGGGKDSVGYIVLELTIGLLNLPWSSRPSAKKHPATTVPNPVVGPDKEFLERFEKLFDKVNMVAAGEGSSKADVQFVGPGANNNNWEATHLPSRKEFWEEIIKTLVEYKDIFAWSYDDMPGLSTDLVVHKLPIDPAFHPVKQKLRKFKIDMNVKIKEEVTKQFDAKVIRFTRYPTWLANVVPVPKKDGKTRSRKQSDHVRDLRKFFQWLRRYNLKLNPAKCAFGVPSGRLLRFIISRRGIELDPSKIKAIQELPPPRNKIEVMSLLGRLNYISRFIAQLTTTYDPIFKLLKKDVAFKWTDECQEAFDKIKGTAIKAQALADNLAENPVDEEYEPLKTYFPDEEVMHIDECGPVEEPGWKLFFDGAANMKGVGIGVA
ncbi:uncharacterized protein [Nicotiana sylvestris]|uniref:uncharacterized protein n=1 Tax=Nicotiana sylvestris TaxID=4096 RepID=UPI00388CB3DA